MTEDEVEKHPRVADWIEKAKSKGACFQCQHPWHDGLCECSVKLNETEMREIKQISISLLG